MMLQIMTKMLQMKTINTFCLLRKGKTQLRVNSEYEGRENPDNSNEKIGCSNFTSESSGRL